MPAQHSSLSGRTAATGIGGALTAEKAGTRAHTPDALLGMLNDMCCRAVDCLPGVHGAGVIVRFRGAPFTAAHTASWVRTLDEQQIEYGDGPILRALRSQSVVACSRGDLLARWPALAPGMADTEIRAVRAEPVPVTHQPAGVLVLYSTTVDLIVPARERLLPIRDLLATALTEYCTAHPHEDHAVRLRRALHTRQLLGHAIGVLTARYRVTDDQARQILTDRADQEHITPASAARAVLREHFGRDSSTATDRPHHAVIPPRQWSR